MFSSDNIKGITEFLDDESIWDEDKRRILSIASDWVTDREKWFDKHNIFQWIYLIKYIGFYPNVRKYILDLYVVVKQMAGR